RWWFNSSSAPTRWRINSKSLRGNQAAKRGQQVGQRLGRRLPDYVVVDVSIAVHDTVAHPDDDGPGDVRSRLAGCQANLTCRFADDFNRPDKRKAQHLVAIDVSTIATGYEAQRRLRRLDH